MLSDQIRGYFALFGDKHSEDSRSKSRGLAMFLRSHGLDLSDAGQDRFLRAQAGSLWDSNIFMCNWLLDCMGSQSVAVPCPAKGAY